MLSQKLKWLKVRKVTGFKIVTISSLLLDNILRYRLRMAVLQNIMTSQLAIALKQGLFFNLYFPFAVTKFLLWLHFDE